MHVYRNQTTSRYPVERAAQLYGIFVGVHPFVDGNGLLTCPKWCCVKKRKLTSIYRKNQLEDG
ncbi:Fic family protein [Alkaliphilus transvaalensis]|uniref:Fic family protein n=1 Tax=Alkaliphilus transvaalensis TaxID=114628 RepID=UPI000A05E4EA